MSNSPYPPSIDTRSVSYVDDQDSHKQEKSPSKSPKKESPKKSPVKAHKSPTKGHIRDEIERRLQHFKKSPTKGSAEMKGIVRRTSSRELSLSGTSEKKDTTLREVQPDDPCLPSGTRSFAAKRSVGHANSTSKEKTDMEKLISNFETKFDNSVLILSERLTKLENTVKTRSTMSMNPKVVAGFGDLLQHLSQLDVVLSSVAHDFDRRFRVSSKALDPDCATEGIGQAKFIVAKLTPTYQSIRRNMQLARSKDISVDLIMRGDDLAAVDANLSASVEDIANIQSYYMAK